MSDGRYEGSELRSATLSPDGAEACPNTCDEQFIIDLESRNTALLADLERTNAILNSATEDAIVALNLGGRVTRWNAGAERITGYASAEVLGRSAELVFTPEDRAAGAFGTELCLALERGSAPNERWHLRKDGSRFWASGSMLPLLDVDGQVQGFLNTFRDRTEFRAEVEHRDLLLGEMKHRIGNTLTIVQSIATQTARHAPQPEEFLVAFNARLITLARSQDVLGSAGADGACLLTLLTRTLTFLDGWAERVTLGGPLVHLPANTALMLSLAVHELATNAVKYGALSVPLGWVRLTWILQRNPDGTRAVEIAWSEHGGPSVEPPTQEGFGSQLLQRGLGGQAGTTVVLDFAQEGLRCRVRTALESS